MQGTPIIHWLHVPIPVSKGKRGAITTKKAKRDAMPCEQHSIQKYTQTPDGKQPVQISITNITKRERERERERISLSLHLSAAHQALVFVVDAACIIVS